jgi:hypothetical protein
MVRLTLRRQVFLRIVWLQIEMIPACCPVLLSTTFCPINLLSHQPSVSFFAGYSPAAISSSQAKA